MGKPRPSLRTTYTQALIEHNAPASAQWVARRVDQSVGNAINVLDRLARNGVIRRKVDVAIEGEVRTVLYWVP